MSKLAHFLKNIEAYVALQHDEEFDSIQVQPDTLKELLSYFDAPESQPQPVAAAAPAPRVQAPAPARPLPVKPAPAPAPKIVKLPAFQTANEIAQHISQCKRCPLNKTRANTVPGTGNTDRPDIMIIGGEPTEEENNAGIPFVGEAGALLDKMIGAMGYRREDLYLTNVIKCRAFYPDTNKDRKPTDAELEECLPYLKAQIKQIQPKVIVALGNTAIHGLLNKKLHIGRIRGEWHNYEGIALLPTYHPTYLIKSPSNKGDAWTDLKSVLTKLGKPIPTPGKK
jgi:DNA polymerase